MSKIVPLIRQAFGTSNPNEAASFLASACNRMKGMDKSAIAEEVTTALKGVNFNRSNDTGQAKSKTVYKDTKATLEKLAECERQLKDVRSQLEAARNVTAKPHEIARLENRIADLQKYIDNVKTQHLAELALVRQQTSGSSKEEVAELKNQFEELTQSANIAMRARVEAERKVTGLEATVAEKEAHIARLKRVLAEVASGGDADTARIKQLEREFAEAIKNLGYALDHAESCQALCTACEKNIADLTAQLNETEDKLAGAHKYIEEQAGKIDGYDSQVSTLLRQLKQDDIERGLLSKRRALVERELEETRTKAIHSAFNLVEANKLKDKAELETRRYYDRTNAAEKENRRLRAELAEMTTQRNKLEKDAQHNFYHCESLNAALNLSQKEVSRYKGHFFSAFGAALVMLISIQLQSPMTPINTIVGSTFFGGMAYWLVFCMQQKKLV